MNLAEHALTEHALKTKIVELDPWSRRQVSYVVEYEPMPAFIKGSVGKMGALLIEKVLVSGGMINVEALAAQVGSKRVRDFKRRHLSKVINAGLLSVDAEGVVSAPSDLQERLTQHLVDTGCDRAAERQMNAIKAQRIKADKAPTNADLRRERKPFAVNLEHMKVRDAEQDHYRELEKVGPTATTFLRDELSGRCIPMSWPSVVERFTKRGGSKKVLDKAAAQLDVRWIKEFDGWYVALREEEIAV